MENNDRQHGSDFNDSSLSAAEHAENHLRFIYWADKEIDRCWPWLEQAMRRGLPPGLVTHTKEDVKRVVFSGNGFLLTTENGVAITTFTEFPQCKIATVWLLGGDFKEVFETHNDKFEQHARAHGASAVYVQGRPGWVRKLRDAGYVECQRLTTKVLSHN